MKALKYILAHVVLACTFLCTKKWIMHVCPIIQQALMIVSIYTNSIVRCISQLVTNLLRFLYICKNNLENT